MRSTHYLMAALSLVASARAFADVPAAHWRIFKDDSSSQFRAADDPLDFEDHLYDAARAQRTQAAARRDFAQRIGVAPNIANEFADVIVSSVTRRERGCGEMVCRFEPSDAYYERVRQLSLLDTSGQLLIIVAKNDPALFSESVGLRHWLPLALSHPAARRIFEAMASYTEEDVFLAGLLVSVSPMDWDPQLIARSYRTERGSNDSSGWMSALLEHAEQRATEANAPLEVRAALAQTRLLRDIDFGFSRAAAERYLQYPAAVRDRLPLLPGDCTTPERCVTADMTYVWLDAMVATLWHEAHRESAHALAQRPGTTWPARDAPAVQRASVLSEFMAPRIADADLFDLFVYGSSQRESAVTALEATRAPRDMAWLKIVRHRPALRPLAVARLRAGNYGELMRQLQPAPHREFRARTKSAALALLAEQLPPSVPDRQKYWQARIAAGRAGGLALPDSDIVAATARPNVPSLPWREAPLPSGLRAWREGACRGKTNKVSAPITPEAIIRHEMTGKEQLIIYQSSDLDLPGELPAYGLWLARTVQGQWQRPAYLGLQQYFPYVATPCSALPLLDGDTLQIEVQVREIDPQSITFPPIATTYRRREDGVVLRASLMSLLTDRDADGLTDIEEGKLRLAVDRRDTDGDGLDDAHDPLPLTAYRDHVPMAHNQRVVAFFEALLGHDANAIVVGPRRDGARPAIEDLLSAAPQAPRTGRSTFFLVVPDPQAFAGISAAPMRIVIYAAEEFSRWSDSRVAFYPPRITTMFSSLDDRRTYIEWSAGWTGGALLIDCTQPDAPCRSEALSQWIT